MVLVIGEELSRDETLIGGEQNALRTLARFGISHWMDDIWDSSMYLKQNNDEYWQGWRPLCLAIDDTVMGDKGLKEDKAMIKNGSHEAVTLLNERFYRFFG